MHRDLKRLVFCARLGGGKGSRTQSRSLVLPSDYYLEVLGEGVERNRLRDQVERERLDGPSKTSRTRVDAATRDGWLGSAGVA